MPKPVINAIMRSEQDYVRQDATQRTKFFAARSKTDAFQTETEYVKALQAAKLQKMFSKPFVRSMGEHADAVVLVEPMTQSTNYVFSASADGCVKLSDITSGEVTASVQAHRGMITGLQSASDLLLTCGQD